MTRKRCSWLLNWSQNTFFWWSYPQARGISTLHIKPRMHSYQYFLLEKKMIWRWLNTKMLVKTASYSSTLPPFQLIFLKGPSYPSIWRTPQRTTWPHPWSSHSGLNICSLKWWMDEKLPICFSSKTSFALVDGFNTGFIIQSLELSTNLLLMVPDSLN